MSLLFTFLVPASSLRVPVLRVVCWRKKTMVRGGVPAATSLALKDGKMIGWCFWSLQLEDLFQFFLNFGTAVGRKNVDPSRLEGRGKSWFSYDDFIRILDLQISSAFTPLWSSYLFGGRFFFLVSSFSLNQFMSCNLKIRSLHLEKLGGRNFPHPRCLFCVMAKFQTEAKRSEPPRVPRFCSNWA